MNGVRTADKLELVLRWRDFPFDPRTVRACAVDFYLGLGSRYSYLAASQVERGDDLQGVVCLAKPFGLEALENALFGP